MLVRRQISLDLQKFQNSLEFSGKSSTNGPSQNLIIVPRRMRNQKWERDKR